MSESYNGALLSPSEEETRVILRALFRRLLALDPSRYSPLYVGPLRRAEPVRRALAEAAAAHGRETGVAAPAVVIAPLAWVDAPSPDAVRVVVVGDVDPDRLPAAFLSRLEATGLIYDTRQTPVPGSAPSPIREALVAVAGGSGPWLLRVAADAESVPVVAAEAALRLRLFGFTTGPVLSRVPDQPASTVLGGEGERRAVVVQLDGIPAPDALERLFAHSRRSAQGTVVVGSASAMAAVATHPMAQCSACVRVGLEVVPEAVRTANWPPAREVLTGAPKRGPEREAISFAEGPNRTLNHLVRASASWDRRGFLLVYGLDRFGWIAVDGAEGVVRGAWRLGDSTEAHAGTEDVLARIRAMTFWPEARALFVAASAPCPEGFVCEVLVDTVDLDIRRTLDEARGPSSDASSQADVPRLHPSRVARELLWWGQSRFAHELLEDAERASGWGVQEELLLGYLSAERDPREAAARLQHAAHRLSLDLDAVAWSQQVDATLAALLLDVRGQPGRAFSAWPVVARWMESQGKEWINTERRAAVMFELAARAGELDHAVCFRDLLRRLARPGDPLPEWLSASDPLLLVHGAA